MDYPCDCSNMKMIIETGVGNFDFNGRKYHLFLHDENFWALSWVQLDRIETGINIEEFGLRLEYCPFCGKKIKG
jgi:hypothetical protein